MEESSSIRIGVQRTLSENVAAPQTSSTPKVAPLIAQNALSSLQKDKDSLKEKADELSHEVERFQSIKERYNSVKKELANEKETGESELKTEALEKRYESSKSELKNKIQDLKYRLQTFDLKGRFTTAKEVGKELLDKVKNIRSENKFFQETKLDQSSIPEEERGRLPVKTKDGKQVEKLKENITKGFNVFLMKDFKKTEEGIQGLKDLKWNMEKLIEMHKDTADPKIKDRIERILPPLILQYNFNAGNKGIQPFSFFGFPKRA